MITCHIKTSCVSVRESPIVCMYMVHSIRGWNTTIQNNHNFLNQHLSCKKRPNMIIGFPQHQHGSHNHMLSFSCVSIHHKISYVFRSVSIHDPDPLTMLNLYQKWSKYVWNSQNLYPVRWFVTSTLYQRFYKSITSILSHSEHNLFWNGVHITCRTFPSAILAAGNLLSRCFIRPSILDWMKYTVCSYVTAC